MPSPTCTTRTYRGTGDLPAMVALRNLRMEADGGEDFSTVEGMAQQYEHLQRCDPLRDILLVESAGELVGYARTVWEDVADGYRAHWIVVVAHPHHPEVEARLYDWVEDRAGTISADLPAGDARLVTWADASTRTATVLEGRGYAPDHYGAVLIRPRLDHVPRRPLPAGVEIRPVAPAHLRKIWEADAEAFRDHRGYVEPTETDWEAWLEGPNWDPTLWRVAWTGEEVVGQVRTYIDPAENERFGRRRGWTEYISTGRAWRRRGIATALICSSLHALRERGMEEAALGVDTENLSGALRLYESLGFVRQRLEAEYHRPLGRRSDR